MDTAAKQIWNSGTGSWRAKFRQIQSKAGLMPTELPETLIEYPEAPEAKVEPPANVVALQAEVTNLKKENGDLKAQLASKTVLLDNLKRSAGILAAQTVANVPNHSGESQSLIDIYNAMPEGPAKTEFFQAHKAELSKFITSPVPKN